MTLVRYDPWKTLNELHREMDRWFNRSSWSDEVGVTADWTPAVDIMEDDGAYTLFADLPGIDPKDIEIDMEIGVLTIRGERENERKDEDDNFKRVERLYGRFYRRFSLPDTADSDSISAKYNDGVLEVHIPKHEKAMPRRIEVQIH